MNPVTAISTVKEAYDLAKDAKEDYNCIIKWINRTFRKPIRILIVGESGTGKTQFLSAIRAKKDFILRSTMASYPCKFELPNGRIVEFMDTPGQQSLISNLNKL